VPCSATPLMYTAVWCTTSRDHFGVSSKLGSKGKRGEREKSHISLLLLHSQTPQFTCYSMKIKHYFGKLKQVLVCCSLHHHLLCIRVGLAVGSTKE